MSTALTRADIVNFDNPTLDDFEHAVKGLMELMADPYYGPQKIKVVFKEPVEARVNRFQIKVLSEMNVKFFESTGGRLCYTFGKRTGWPVGRYLEYGKVARLSIEPAIVLRRKKIDRILSLGRRIHPNAWDDLRKGIESEPGHYLQYGLNELSMAARFPSHVLEQLQQAFETKTDFSYERPGITQRDRRVEVRMCGDGILRAWYTSEYVGCGNGGYYLLINPTTATFCEYD